MINYKYYIYYQNVILLKLLIYNLFNLIQIKHNYIQIYIMIFYYDKKINYIGIKYLGLTLSKLIKLTYLKILIYLNCFIINDKYFLVLF